MAAILNKDMKKLFIVIAVLALTACQPTTVSPDGTGLPMASQMEVKGKIRPPAQAIEFCKNNPEFEEKC